jgi:glutaredoxin
MRASAFAAIALATACVAAHAQQYRWTDEKGRVQYSDTLPPASARNVEKKNFRGNAVGAQTGFALTRAMHEAPVKLYTHPVCKEPCDFARDVLRRRGVPFSEVVASEPAIAQELKDLSGGDSVPVLVVGPTVVKTVSAEAYNGALDAAGYPPAGVGTPASPPSAAR